MPKVWEITQSIEKQAAILSQQCHHQKKKDQVSTPLKTDNMQIQLRKKVTPRLLDLDYNIISISRGASPTQGAYKNPYRSPTIYESYVLLLWHDKSGFSVANRTLLDGEAARVDENDVDTYCFTVFRIRQAIFKELIEKFGFPEDLKNIKSKLTALVERQLRLTSAYLTTSMARGAADYRILRSNAVTKFHNDLNELVFRVTSKITPYTSGERTKSFEVISNAIRARLFLLTVFRPTTFPLEVQHRSFLVAAGAHFDIEMVTLFTTMDERMADKRYTHHDDLMDLPVSDCSNFNLPKELPDLSKKASASKQALRELGASGSNSGKMMVEDNPRGKQKELCVTNTKKIAPTTASSGLLNPKATTTSSSGKTYRLTDQVLDELTLNDRELAYPFGIDIGCHLAEGDQDEDIFTAIQRRK